MRQNTCSLTVYINDVRHEEAFPANNALEASFFWGRTNFVLLNSSPRATSICREECPLQERQEATVEICFWGSMRNKRFLRFFLEILQFFLEYGWESFLKKPESTLKWPKNRQKGAFQSISATGSKTLIFSTGPSKCTLNVSDEQEHLFLMMFRQSSTGRAGGVIPT